MKETKKKPAQVTKTESVAKVESPKNKAIEIAVAQIEISRYIREDEGLRKSFVKNLSDIINKRFV